MAVPLWWVRANPRPLCTDFQADDGPSAFWCRTCHWNGPMHAEDELRQQIAELLQTLTADPAP